jgi:hypothetical protein
MATMVRLDIFSIFLVNRLFAKVQVVKIAVKY